MIFSSDESVQTPSFERAQIHAKLCSKDVFHHSIMQTIGNEHFGQTIRWRVQIYPYGLDHQMTKKGSNPTPFRHFSDRRTTFAVTAAALRVFLGLSAMFGDRLRARMDMKFFVNVLDMRGNGAISDLQRLGNFLVKTALREQF